MIPNFAQFLLLISRHNEEMMYSVLFRLFQNLCNTTHFTSTIILDWEWGWSEYLVAEKIVKWRLCKRMRMKFKPCRIMKNKVKRPCRRLEWSKHFLEKSEWWWRPCRRMRMKWRPWESEDLWKSENVNERKIWQRIKLKENLVKSLLLATWGREAKISIKSDNVDNN